jgi:hypothetical protein
MICEFSLKFFKWEEKDLIRRKDSKDKKILKLLD